MKHFLDEDFLLNTKTARVLFHDFARHLPIIDYHNHLPPAQIAASHNFANITQAWLNGDHYKWRAMRINGVTEDYITGSKSDEEKFAGWAGTVPYTMRNPLYHWTHLELRRYFGITDLLSGDNAAAVYTACSQKLQTPQFNVPGLLHMMNVETVCTTDDPLDDLAHHQHLKRIETGITVLPTFRPDKAMNADDPQALNTYINRLEETVNASIGTLDEYLEALKKRHDHFAKNGCKLSDHGLEQVYAEEFTEDEAGRIFRNIRSGREISRQEVLKFKSAMLYWFAVWDHEKGWVQQYHVGAMRNNNSRMLAKLGPDTGWDSMGDYSQAAALARFLNRLDKDDRLAKTILYNLNPADNEVMATMTGNYNDGSVAGKIQWGSAWWFLDQKDGMTKQINALSNMGLLSRFVGMITDSRSFLSFPRHEYFRRILCGLFGDDVENGELPDDTAWLGKIVKDICYYNAKNYFDF